jgi:hypothetical protein
MAFTLHIYINVIHIKNLEMMEMKDVKYKLLSFVIQYDNQWFAIGDFKV